MSWQRTMDRLCLAGYCYLRNAQWVEKFEWVHLGILHHIVLGKLSLFKLMIDGSYVLYRLCVLSESVRTHTTWKVVVSAGKIFATAMSLSCAAWTLPRVVRIVGVTGLHLVLDCYVMKQRMNYV